MKARISNIAAVAILLAASLTYAAVPTSITVQGRLTDTSGVPLPAGPKAFLFRIFDVPSNGTEIWSGEDQFLTTGTDGLWIAMVGSIVGLNDAVFADTVRWLDITVNGTTLPRVRLVTGAYAYRVSTVDGATGGTISSKVSIGPGTTNAGVDAFAAGAANQAAGDFSVVSGGRNCRARGDYSVIGGGGGASLFDSNSAGGDWGSVGGGQRNLAREQYSTVAGGFDNQARDSASTIGGGSGNVASATGSTVSGGKSNVCGGYYASVGGGQSHFITTGSIYSTVSGGLNNGMSFAEYSAIPGGRDNTASADYCFAAGRRAKAANSGSFVWADSTDADFTTSAASQFLIRAAGGVGIGTNAPEAPLHVFEGSAGTVTASTNSSAVFERNTHNYVTILGPDNSDRGVLFGSPLNAASGGIIFDPAGLDNGLQFRTNTNDIRMSLDASGNLTVVGCVDGNNTACASDARFKRNIATVDNAVDLVKNLRGVSYEWRQNEYPDQSFEPGKQYGVIAQEVREVLPELVREREDGYLSVEYNGLIPFLIEAIKEQQREIESLKLEMKKSSQ